jgi:hypothetical protein
MPFAGGAEAARAAVESLRTLDIASGDELILSDNSGGLVDAPGITVVRALGERSPAYARNVGAEHVRNEWILFLDADCRPPGDLLDIYFAVAVNADVGALAGQVVPAAEGRTVAARYGASRNFLGQQAHRSHPYRPRAVAANLMVRREVFQQLGGFYEGVRAAEDTDFSWRLQQAGWRIEFREQAAVEHAYRVGVGELRRQWRGYAAGRAWLGRRYDGFTPEPAIRRALLRGTRRSGDGGTALVDRHGASTPPLERTRHLAIDLLLAGEELAGLVLSNRPPRSALAVPAHVVLVAERFPSPEDPLVELARTLGAVRVEATARPSAVAVDIARQLRIDYREDDGVAARTIALARLALRHPVRCAADVIRHRGRPPGLAALAPAVIRLRGDPEARLLALGGADARATARRLAALAGRRLDERARS